MKIFIKLSSQLVRRAEVTGSPLKHTGQSLKP
jgi:hypothetical protein